VLWLVIGLGGALGSLARHGVNIAVGRVAGQPVPYATALVNILGCVCIGALAGAIAGGRLEMSPTARAFLLVGVLGGFTTFSSLGLDTLALAQQGQVMTAVWNVAGQVAIGLLGVFGAYALVLRFS
jgi:CrcB protein